jgi:WXXGXW repeat (2 copies)
MRIRAFFALSLLAASVGSVALAQSEITTAEAPPPLRVEIAPPAKDGYTWSPGHWEWSGHSYFWVSGNWVVQRRGAHYVENQWQQVGSSWHFVKAHWER